MLLKELRYILLQKKFALDFASYIDPISPGRGGGEGVFHPSLRFSSVILEPQKLLS